MEDVKNPFESTPFFQEISFDTEKLEEEKKEKEIEDILDKEPKEKESEVKVKDALNTKDKNYDYSSAVEMLIENGYWKDFEGREEIEITKEIFEELVKEQEKNKKKEIKESVFSSLDENDKEFLEFKKNGGDLVAYINNFNKSKILKELSLDTDQDKINVIHTYYKNVVGWKDEKIGKYIQKLIDDMEFEDEAKSAYEHLTEKVNKEKQELLDQQAEIAKKRREAMDAYKKDLKETLKATNTDSSKISNIIKGITEPKKDQQNLTEIDLAYVAAKNDPEKAIQLYNFLTDFESFKKNMVSKSTQEEHKKLVLEFKNAKKDTKDEIKPKYEERDKVRSPFKFK